jgi:hypothetical protein
VFGAGLLTPPHWLTAGLLAVRETFGRAQWLGQETGHKVRRPATRSGDRPQGQETGHKVRRPATRSGDRPQGQETGHNVRDYRANPTATVFSSRSVR